MTVKFLKNFLPIVLLPILGSTSITHAQTVPGIQQGPAINQNANNPISEYNSPYASLESGAKNFANFWTSLRAPSNPNLLNTDTVITGVLQEDLSSKKNKPGDIFSIMLPDNYTVNNKLLIPQYSKFVGSVVSAIPAASAGYGKPGTLEVSIQTLVSPQGVSIPINASIEYNPNQSTKTDTKKSRGIPAGEWAKSAVYSVHYAAEGIGSRLGLPIFYKGQTGKGPDFALEKGEVLPVKLTQPLDVSALLSNNNPVNNASPAPSMAPPAVPPIAPPANPNNNFEMPPGMQTPPQIMQGAPNNNTMPGFNSPAGPEPF